MTGTPDRQEKPFVIPMPLLGLNTLDNTTQMDPSYASDLYNVELDILGGYAKRSGFVTFNSTIMPVTFTGSISGITGTHVGALTGVVWSGVITNGMIFRMASGSNAYIISNLFSNVSIGLMSSYSDTVTTGSYFIGPAGVDGLYAYNSGTTQRLVAFGGGTMFNGGTSYTGTFVNLWASLKGGASVSATVYQDKIWFCNGYQYQYWDGTNAIASVGGSPSPSDPKYITKYVIGNATYLCILGSNTDANRSMMSFSDVNAPTTYPANNQYYVGQGDGGQLTGGIQVPNGLLAFKDNGIFMFGGVPGTSGSLARLSDISCPCPKTIKLWQGTAVFVGMNKGRLGVYMYVGGNSVTYISPVMEPKLDTLNKLYLTNITAEIYKNKYTVSCPSTVANYNDTHYAFYLDRLTTDSSNRVTAPCVTGNLGRNCFANVTINGSDYLFSGSPTSGYVYRESYGVTDDTTDNLYGGVSAISAWLTTKDFDLGRIDVNKEVLRAYTNLSSLGAWNLNLDLYTDFSTYGYTRYLINMTVATLRWQDVIFLVTPWQTAVNQQITEIKMMYPSIAKFFKFKLSNNGASQYFSAFPMTLFFKEESR